MDESTPDSTGTQSIDLAQEAGFHLGSLHVRPARCEVESGGVSQTLQRRVMQVLVALARARGSVVSQSDLVARCWHGLSVSDDAIFRCVGKLRKLAADYPDAPYAIETIPGVGYRLTSPSMVEGDPLAEAARPHNRRFRLRAWWAVAALAAMILIGAAFWIAREQADRGHPPIRVAVQPFETLGDSGEGGALARRIPNEIVDALGDSQVEAALAREQAGKEAAAGNTEPGLIVTGMLRNEGGAAVVDVRIEDGATHAALWSTEFKRDMREASDLPLEVAARVADVVNMVIFARGAKPPLNDDSALSGLLQASDMIRDSDDERWAQLLARAQDIVARHPEFAFGHSVLAEAYAQAAENINGSDRARAMSDAAREEAKLTLKLDPQDAGAYAVLSDLADQNDYSAREAILLRGIKFAKHPKEPLGALYAYESEVLESVGRLEEALSYQLIGQATDQWSPAKMTKLVVGYANIGNLAAARSTLQKAVQRWPNHAAVRGAQLYVAGFYEQPSDALATINLLSAPNPAGEDQTASWRSFIDAKIARSAVPAAVLKIREAADQGKISRENEIMMLAGLGETKQAIDAANDAVDHQQLRRPRILFTPVTRNLRQDPGFVPLASRLGLIQYWRETRKLPDFCTDPARRSECSPQLLAALKS